MKFDECLGELLADSRALGSPNAREWLQAMVTLHWLHRIDCKMSHYFGDLDAKTQDNICQLIKNYLLSFESGVVRF